MIERQKNRNRIEVLTKITNNKIFGITTEQEKAKNDSLAKNLLVNLTLQEQKKFYQCVDKAHNELLAEKMPEAIEEIKKCNTLQELINLMQGNSSQTVPVPLDLSTSEQPSSSLYNTSVCNISTNFMQPQNYYNR